MSSPKPTLFILNRNYSTWSLRAWLAMRQLNIDFDVEMFAVGGPTGIADLGEESQALMKTAGPTSKVPVLHTVVDGQKLIVFETLAILEFLAEDYPTLLPVGRAERSLMRSLAAEMATSFSAIRNYSMNIRQNYKFDPELFVPRAQKDLTRLSEIWEERRQAVLSKGGVDEGFLFGTFTAIDCMYAPVCFRLKTFDLISKIGPLGQAYVHHMLALPSMKEWEAEALKETHLYILSDEVYPLAK